MEYKTNMPTFKAPDNIKTNMPTTGNDIKTQMPTTEHLKEKDQAPTS